jgi:transposase-like protein
MIKPVIRYSEAFKRQVVDELENGKFSSISEAQRAYRIKGNMTVRNWVLRYGTQALLPKYVRVQTMKERDELKDAKARIRELEAALSDAHVDHVLEKAYLHVACDRMGVDPDDFKKKNATTLSKLRKNSRKDLR